MISQKVVLWTILSAPSVRRFASTARTDTKNTIVTIDQPHIDHNPVRVNDYAPVQRWNRDLLEAIGEESAWL